MKVAGIILLVLCGLALISATRNVVTMSSSGSGDAAFNVGYIVGSFMVPWSY